MVDLEGARWHVDQFISGIDYFYRGPDIYVEAVNRPLDRDKQRQLWVASLDDVQHGRSVFYLGLPHPCAWGSTSSRG